MFLHDQPIIQKRGGMQVQGQMVIEHSRDLDFSTFYSFIKADGKMCFAFVL